MLPPEKSSKLVRQLSKTSSANLELIGSVYEHDWFMKTAFFLALRYRNQNQDPYATVLQTVFLSRPTVEAL